MMNTDMILWQAQGATSLTRDLWSTSFIQPSIDTNDNLSSTFVVNSNRTVTFTTTRPMDTNDPQDYAVNYDQQIVMVYGQKSSGASFTKHDSYGWFSLQFNTPVDGQSLITSDVVEVEDPADRYREHGWWMWTTWCLCGWLMIATKRYMKKGWLISQLCHSLIGTYITVVTIVMVYKILEKRNFILDEVEPHVVVALSTFGLALITYFTGFLGGFLGKFHIGYKPWGHHAEIHTRIWKAHA